MRPLIFSSGLPVKSAIAAIGIPKLLIVRFLQLSTAPHGSLRVSVLHEYKTIPRNGLTASMFCKVLHYAKPRSVEIYSSVQ